MDVVVDSDSEFVYADPTDSFRLYIDGNEDSVEKEFSEKVKIRFNEGTEVIFDVAGTIMPFGCQARLVDRTEVFRLEPLLDSAS